MTDQHTDHLTEQGAVRSLDGDALLRRAIADGAPPQSHAEVREALMTGPHVTALIDAAYRTAHTEAHDALEAALAHDDEPQLPWAAERIAAVHARYGLRPSAAYSTGWIGTGAAYFLEALFFPALAPWPDEIAAARSRIQKHFDSHAGEASSGR